MTRDARLEDHGMLNSYLTFVVRTSARGTLILTLSLYIMPRHALARPLSRVASTSARGSQRAWRNVTSRGSDGNGSARVIEGSSKRAQPSRLVRRDIACCSEGLRRATQCTTSPATAARVGEHLCDQNAY